MRIFGLTLAAAAAAAALNCARFLPDSCCLPPFFYRRLCIDFHINASILEVVELQFVLFLLCLSHASIFLFFHLYCSALLAFILFRNFSQVFRVYALVIT